MLSFAHLLSIYGMSEPSGSAAWATVLRLMPGWLWEADADFRLTYVSEGLEDHSNLRRSDLEGLCILDTLQHSGPMEAGIAEYHNKLRAHEPVEQMLYERIMVSGERAVFLDSALPKFDKQGRFQGYRGMTFHLSHALASADQKLGVVADLKVRAETLEAMLAQRNSELEHSNATMSEVLDAMGEGLLVTSGANLNDPTNRISFVNPEFHKLFGFAPKEFYPGRPLRDVVNALLDRGEIDLTPFATIDALLARPDGTKMHLTVSGRTLYISGAQRPNGGFVLLLTDMTEVETQHIKLEKARQDADVANRAKSNFLASMSHEIRTPMNGVVGMTDLLALTDLDAEQRDCVDTIRASALALTSLISDILDFSKVEAGRFEVSLAPMSLRETSKEILSLMRPLAEEKGLMLTSEIAADAPDFVMADQARVRQILVNLLGNAIKFTLSGSVRLVVKSGTPTVIAVEDTGIGIPGDKLERIFDPFEQAQGGLQRQFEGTGLGLAISKKLVEAMQGDIWVNSREGLGTVFFISLPLRSCDAPATTAKPSDSVAALGQAHILVAEDNRTNQIVVERMLKRLGVTCSLADDGREAVAAFGEGGFDGILMDLSMPKLNGLDACKMIRQIEKDRGLSPIPIIALTGNAFSQDMDAAKAAGMTGFLSKPLQLKTLTKELARHFSSAQAKAS